MALIASLSRARPIQSRFSEARLKELEKKIEEVVIKNRLFLDEELSLGMLAAKLNLNFNDLSAYLNNVYQKNFYSFINEFRVEYAKKQLLDTEKSVLEIGYLSGFKAKSSFNRVFKQIVGKTPTEYRESNSIKADTIT